MFISISKLFALILGLLVIAKTYLDYRKKEENLLTFLLWTILWLVIIVVAFSPMLIDRTIILIGDKSITIGKIVGMGFIFILFIIYRIYVKANRLEKQFNKLVRKIALNGLKNNNKK